MEQKKGNPIHIGALRQRSKSLDQQAAESNELVFRRHFSDFDLWHDHGAGGDAKCKRLQVGTLIERQQCKATRVSFFRNLNPYFRGIVLPISKERYRTFEALLDELTALLSCRVKLTSAICKVMRIDGRPVTNIDAFVEDDICVCCCKYEAFKNFGYQVKWNQMARMRKREPQLQVDNILKLGKLMLPQLFSDLFEIDQSLSTNSSSSLYMVRHAYWRANKYVLKYVPIEKTHDFLRNEKSILLKLQHHENIIDLYMSFESPKLIVLLLECLNCDLAKLLYHFGIFSEFKARTIVRTLGRGLKYMHDKSIVHRDIKLENILVNCDAKGNIVQLKIADFGLSVVKGVNPLFQFCGTPHYMAPEIITNEGYNNLVDCWSMGVLLFIGLTIRQPFGNQLQRHEEIYKAILCEKYDPNVLPTMGVGTSLCELVRALLSKLPCARPNAAEILRYRFVKDRA